MTDIPAAQARLNPILGDYFYFTMSLIVASTVVFGFSHTVSGNLFHPSSPRPFILYVHAALFTSWLALFVVQTGLVRSGQTRSHMRLGVAGAVLAAAMFVVGIATAIAMRKFRVTHDAGEIPAFLSIPFNDVTVFAGFVATALYWRNRDSEFHRRFMLMASCVLTGAGFARFPGVIGTHVAYAYACADLLIVLAVLRDMIVIKRIHPAYLYGLPVSIAGHVLADYLWSYPPPFWQAMTAALVR